MRTPAKPPRTVAPVPSPKPAQAPKPSAASPTSGRSLLELPVSAPGGRGEPEAVAERGFQGAPRALPYRDRIEHLLGHDLSGVKAYIGGPAAAATQQLRADAYTSGDRIAFRQVPDFRLATHEAVHVVQQRFAPSILPGISQPSARDERIAHAIADRVVSGAATDRVLATGPVPALQRQQAPSLTPDEMILQALEFWDNESQSRDPGPEKAKARRMFLLLNRPRPLTTLDEVDAFIDECEALAEDEQKTWDALAKDGATDEQFISEGVAFPNMWADRVDRELRGTANERDLADRYVKARQEALANTSGISDEVWGRGLPLSRDQAARLTRAQIPTLALDFKIAKKYPNEAVGRYAKLLVTWERTLTHLFLVQSFRFRLGVHVDQIRKGEIVIDDATYKEVLGARFFNFKLALFENAASTPDDMRAAVQALMLQRPTQFFRTGYTSGFSFKWSDEAINALWSEIHEVDDKLKAASFDERIWRSMVWGYERGYFGDAAIEAYHAIKDDWLKMIATAVAIIVAQAIPGLNIAVNTVLLIEFGLDALALLFELKDTFEAAGSAKTVDAMQRASVKMANTLVGTAARIVIWAATWGARKLGTKIKKWREGQKFLDEHGNSAEAREALAKAKGDVEKARKTLEEKRAQERAAKAKQEKERREREEAERKKREEAERKQREQEEAERRAEEARRKQEEEAKRKQEEEAKRKQEEEAKRKPEEEAKRKQEGAKPEKKQEKKKGKAEEGKFPCFTAGTLVLTPRGARPIESIAVGDEVLAQHPGDAAEPTPHQVTATHVSASRHLVRIGTALASHRHSFWTSTRGWVQAGELVAEDILQGPGGVPIRVEFEQVQSRAPIETYNLTVFGVRTFFVVVGDFAALVHNTDLPPFDQTLYWVFGKTVDVRPTDTDGKSVWRTDNREEVNKLFEIRVKHGRPMSDPHLCFTESDAKEAGLKVNKTAAHVVGEPSTPGEKVTADLVQNKLDHYSLRPKGAVDIPEGLSYDELQARKDLHLSEEQMKDLAERAKSLKTTDVRPRNLKC